MAGSLGGGEHAGSFSARITAPADDLQLAVSGIGPVALPVRAPGARKLVALARPARFGQGEHTLIDASVRDTWEIVPDQITLGGSRWAELLERAMVHFHDELGLPSTARLRAEPHSMLVYGKGQFFLPHQDSESDDEMVASLVMLLPSIHTGGDLLITHGGESRVYHGSREELTLVAFYADCRHEVKPVRSGYRATITFNLLRTGTPPEPGTEPDAELVADLVEHFATSTGRSYGGDPLDPPNRLVFLLDHEYTQRGLSWERLKGVDVARAARLRAAAERAGCEAVPALAQVKETREAMLVGAGYGWDYVEVTDSPDAVEPGELIDDETTLTWWVPDGSAGEPISLFVRDHEVCAATPNEQLTATRAEYEGYMGNYGNTLDRWYQRGAVVVWPAERAFAARAEAGSLRALHELRERVAVDLDGARAAAGSLAPFWMTVGGRAELLGATLEIAAGIAAAETASMLLRPFRLEMLTAEHAAGLAAVAARYGDEWTNALVEGWFDPRHHGPEHDEWVGDQLPGISSALRAAGSPQLARGVSTRTWHRMNESIQTWTRVERADDRRPCLERMSTPLLRLLEVADGELREVVIRDLSGFGDAVLECLMPALRQASPAQAPWLVEIARGCGERLDTITARPPRAADDWSITWTGCGCELCTTLGRFLGAGSEVVLRWPLRQDGRRHIHGRIDVAGLPVRHQTERRGRPYTLVLTKTADLFTREASARAQAVAELAWLRSVWGMASPTT